MKQIGFFLCLFLLNAAQGVQLVTDPFPYPAMDLTTAPGSIWTVHSGVTPVNVVVTPSDSGNSLSFAGFLASSGNRIVVNQTQTADVGTDFPAQVTQDNTSLYASFLVKYTTQPSASGEYFSSFFDQLNPMGLRGRIYGKASGANTQLGIRFSSKGTTNYASNLLPLNTTHLVVAKYTRVAGADNDKVALFVDPVPGMAEPMPSATVTNNVADDPDVTDIQRFGLRQTTSIGILELDEFRVGTTWADVTSGGVNPPNDSNLVSVVASDPNASEEGANPGVFTITRNNTNALEVFYTLSGTATNEVDYAKLMGSVQIPANMLSANVVINPIADGLDEEPETTVLTLKANNKYDIDAVKANAVVTITDKPTTGLIEPLTFLKIKPFAETIKFVKPSQGFTIKGRFYNQSTNSNVKAIMQYALEWGEGSNKITTGFANMPTKQKIKGPKQGKGSFIQKHAGRGLSIPAGFVNILLRARQGSQNFSFITTNMFQYELK